MSSLDNDHLDDDSTIKTIIFDKSNNLDSSLLSSNDYGLAFFTNDLSLNTPIQYLQKQKNFLIQDLQEI